MGEINAAITGRHEVQAFGFGYFSANEKSTGTGTSTWYGDAGATLQSGLVYSGRF